MLIEKIAGATHDWAAFLPQLRIEYMHCETQSRDAHPVSKCLCICCGSPLLGVLIIRRVWLLHFSSPSYLRRRSFSSVKNALMWWRPGLLITC